MGDNVQLIYDLINYLNTKNKPGSLLCLDFEKAFDSAGFAKFKGSLLLQATFCRYKIAFHFRNREGKLSMETCVCRKM